MEKRRKKRRRVKSKCKMIEITLLSKCDVAIETRFGTITYLEYLIKLRHELVLHGRHVTIKVTKNKCSLLVNNIVGECLL